MAWKKGNVPWNKGLTKETDERLKKLSNSCIHPFKGKTLEELGHKLESCKCAACRAKRGEYKKENNWMYGRHGKNNPHYGKKRTGDAYKNIKNAQLKRLNDNPKAWTEMSKKGAKTTNEKYPDLFINSIKKYYDKHPNARRKVAIKTNKKWKEEDPDDYYKKKRYYVKLMLEKRIKQKEEDPEAFKLKYSKIAINRIEKSRQNSPYMWQEVSFLSKLEMDCAKLLLNNPIDGFNCHVKLNRKIIDFFPQIGDKQYIGCFVEFHPWDWDGLSDEEYYEQRKKAIDNSEYKGAELFVITNLNEVI